MSLSKEKIGSCYLTKDGSIYRLETYEEDSQFVMGDRKFPARMLRLGDIKGWERYSKYGVHYDNKNRLIKEITKEEYPEYFLWQ